jgi:hypothetical protein
VIRVERYRKRLYAVYEDDALLVVCCYRKGAEAVKERIEQLQQWAAGHESEDPALQAPVRRGTPPWTA